MVGPGGLEPPTSRLSSARSNQLSYEPRRLRAEDGRRKIKNSRRLKPALIPSVVSPLSSVFWFGKGEEGGGEGCILVVSNTGREASARPHFCRLPSDFSLPILRKEVIQPQVPLRLPCYDFTPVADLTVAACPLAVSAAS